MIIGSSFCSYIRSVSWFYNKINICTTVNSINPDTQDKLLAKIQDNHLLQKTLIDDLWLTLRQANQIIKNYPIPYIKESIQIVKQKRITWVIKNLPAYTLAVLKKDYETISKTKQDKKIQSEIPKQTTATMSSSNSSATSKKVKEYFAKLSKVEQDKLIKEFEVDKIYWWFFEAKYIKKWLEDTMFRVMFESWLSSKN